MGMAVLVVSITSYAWLNTVLGRGVLGLAVLVYSVLWLTLRLLIYHYFFRREPFCYRVAVLGTGPRARNGLAMVQNVELRPKHIVVAMIQVDHANEVRTQDSVSPDPDPIVIHCSPIHVAATVRSLACNVLLVAVENESELVGVYSQMRRLRFEGVSVLSPLNVAEIYSGKVPLALVDENWLMNASQGHVSPMAMRVKRVVDIVIVLMTAPLTLYFGVLTALLIKLSAPRSPLFYTQERVGRFGKVFKIHKFRTMTVGAEQEQGPVWSPENDARITWAGRSLRKYRLDELPQLWNVLKGEMSLVGPRPERPEMVEKLEKLLPFYRERENLLPGLSGWAQIRYPYGSTIEDAKAKLEFDLYYLQNLSVTLDLQIILRTLRIVVFGLERETR
jgi:exopolysaccharide biosynthesis polyprenyl glycosylphosphotransferase